MAHRMAGPWPRTAQEGHRRRVCKKDRVHAQTYGERDVTYCRHNQDRTDSLGPPLPDQLSRSLTTLVRARTTLRKTSVSAARRPMRLATPARRLATPARRLCSSAFGGCPYQILGVERGSTTAEIKAAWRREVLRHHPDHSPGDPRAAAKFERIQQAYASLTEASSNLRWIEQQARNRAAETEQQRRAASAEIGRQPYQR